LNIGVFMRYSKLNSLPYYYLTGLANATSVDTIILYKAELRVISTFLIYILYSICEVLTPHLHCIRKRLFWNLSYLIDRSI